MLDNIRSLLYTSNMRSVMNDIIQNPQSLTPLVMFPSLAQAGTLRSMPMAVGLSKNHQGPAVASYELAASDKLDVLSGILPGSFLSISKIIMAVKFWSTAIFKQQVLNGLKHDALKRGR